MIKYSGTLWQQCLCPLLINFVDLIRKKNVIKEFVGVAPLSRQHYPVVGQDAQTGASMTNGLHGILHLVQATLRGEDSCFRVIATSLQRLKHCELYGDRQFLLV